MKRYLFVVLLSSLVLNLYARDFANGEKIYLNTDQSHESLDWGADDAKVFLYFFGGSSGDACFYAGKDIDIVRLRLRFGLGFGFWLCGGTDGSFFDPAGFFFDIEIPGFRVDIGIADNA